MESKPISYTLPICHDKKIKLLTIPSSDISYKDFITLIEDKLQLNKNWKQNFQLQFRYQNNLYTITSEEDIQTIIGNKVKLISLYPLGASLTPKKNQIEPQANQINSIARKAEWLSDPNNKGMFSNNKTAHKVKCEGCDLKKIIGQRFKCCYCNEFNYCEKCYIEHMSKNKKHPHMSFISISKTKDYEREAQEYFQFKIKQENENALEMKKSICEGFQMEATQLQLISNLSNSKLSKKKRKTIAAVNEEERSKDELRNTNENTKPKQESNEFNLFGENDQENEQKVNQEQEHEEDQKSVHDDSDKEDDANNDIEINREVNANQISDKLNELEANEKEVRDDEGQDIENPDSDNNDMAIEDYGDLFEDEKPSDEIAKIINIDEPNDKLFITLNNNMKHVPMGMDHMKKWESIEVEFDTNCSDIYCYPKKNSSIDLTLCYVSLSEKKVKFMFDIKENYSIGSTYNYSFLLYSINSNKVIRSQETSILINIK